MIPGSNILAIALTAIAPSTLSYYKNTGLVTGVSGLEVPTYAAPVQVKGSFQPVPRNLYEIYGLDFSKEYFNLYISKLIIGVDRDSAGDQLGFSEARYKCKSVTPWSSIDGWNAVLCVKVDDD